MGVGRRTFSNAAHAKLQYECAALQNGDTRQPHGHGYVLNAHTMLCAYAILCSEKMLTQ